MELRIEQQTLEALLEAIWQVEQRAFEAHRLSWQLVQAGDKLRQQAWDAYWQALARQQAGPEEKEDLI